MDEVLEREALLPLATALARAVSAVWGQGEVEFEEAAAEELPPMAGVRLSGPLEAIVLLCGDLAVELPEAIAAATADFVGEVCGQPAAGELLTEVPEAPSPAVAMGFAWRLSEGGLEGHASLVWPAVTMAELAVALSGEQQPGAEPFPPLGEAAATGPSHNIELLLDVPLELTVELGRAEKQIREILALGAGAIVELDRLAGEPVDVLVNGKLIACGEVVVIDESFGVRITDILSPDERLNRLR